MVTSDCVVREGHSEGTDNRGPAWENWLGKKKQKEENLVPGPRVGINCGGIEGLASLK